MKKSYIYIVLTYGLFLGWLLSFPYTGTVLKHLALLHNVSVASYSLTYTIAPAVYLIIYSFITIKEDYAKRMITWSIAACFGGSVFLFAATPSFWWYPVLALMGIASVQCIIGWSYFYTLEVSIAQKMRIMALVIITGNIISYVINILHDKISSGMLLILILTPLAGSFWAALSTNVEEKITIDLEHEPLPKKLIFVICFFLFTMNITDGLTFHTIYPSFDRLFPHYFTYYGVLPYIITLTLIFFLVNKLSITPPIFWGTSLLGLAHLSFGLLGESWYNFFITETFLNIGWALLDLTLWTLFGLVASIYGRPLKICGYAFLANLSGVFCGGLLGVYIPKQLDNYFLVSAAFAIGIIFLSLLIIPWLNGAIEKKVLRKKLSKTAPQAEPEEKNTSEPFVLPCKELLTRRETEIADLLLKGYTNKQIAGILILSENTIKTHTRKIYSKFKVANKRELMQLKYSPNPPQSRGLDQL